MAKVVPPPIGAGIVEEHGFMSPAWLQWFLDVEQNTAQGLVELSSATISSDETLTLTTGITADYDHYTIKLQDMLLSQPGDVLNVRVSEDEGSTYKSGAADYTWLIEQNLAGTQTSSTDSADSELTINDSGFGNSVDSIINGTVEFFTPANTVNAKFFKWELSYKNNSGDLTMTKGTGLYNGTGAVDAIKLYLNTGKFTSGSYKLFGVK
jgi:hypothetical protein